MQYVICKFRAEDKRGYTYHWNGNPLSPGDDVKVPDKSGDGWVRVVVDEVGVAKPTKFDTKGIIGLAPPAAPKELDLGEPKCTCPPLDAPISTEPQPICPVHQL